ncbi:MAG: LysR family transcriptional regulator [Oligoflexia bacterium]|nr:LysR family transcriptional regulator [Oligoflexia bacterium]
MELNYLKYFYSVAKSGGFSRASRLLGVQQPSITRGVKNLEEQLGVLLFERNGKTVSFTRVGQEVYSACERIFQEAQTIRAIAEAETHDCKGQLKLATANPISIYLIPQILESYTKKFPDVWPQVFVGSASDLMVQIANSNLEFGLFFYAPALVSGIQVTTLSTVRFHLVISANLKNDIRTKARFIGSREIEDPNTKRFPMLEKLRKTIPQAKLALSTNDISAHREMAPRGLGVAILPGFMVADDLANGRLIDLFPKEDQRFSLKLLTRKHAILSRPAQLFIEEIKHSEALL